MLFDSGIPDIMQNPAFELCYDALCDRIALDVGRLNWCLYYYLVSATTEGDQRSAFEPGLGKQPLGLAGVQFDD